MKLIQFSSKRQIKYLKQNYAVDVVQRKTENACLGHFGERRTEYKNIQDNSSEEVQESV